MVVSPARANRLEGHDPGTRDLELAPLVAVCGVCGGAGASTLAYLLACIGARQSVEPVLCCDAGGTAGGLAVYACVESPLSLPAISRVVAAGSDPGAMVALSPDGVRVLASRSMDHDDGADANGLARVLHDAREAHRLTVVDCGTLSREVSEQAVGLASHVLWVLPATASACARAASVLSRASRVAPAGRHALVARLDREERRVALRELTALAEANALPLVLFPHVGDIIESGVETALAEAEVVLQALVGFLSR